MSNRERVQFKSSSSVSIDLVQKLLQKGESFGLTEVIPFAVEKIIVAEWVHLKCRYGCKQYNTNWCCPPATPSSDMVRRILNNYTQAVLLVEATRCRTSIATIGAKGQYRCDAGKER